MHYAPAAMSDGAVWTMRVLAFLWIVGLTILGFVIMVTDWIDLPWWVGFGCLMAAPFALALLPGLQFGRSGSGSKA